MNNKSNSIFETTSGYCIINSSDLLFKTGKSLDSSSDNGLDVMYNLKYIFFFGGITSFISFLYLWINIQNFNILTLITSILFIVFTLVLWNLSKTTKISISNITKIKFLPSFPMVDNKFILIKFKEKNKTKYRPIFLINSSKQGIELEEIRSIFNSLVKN